MKSSISIRNMTSTDIPTVTAIERRTFTDPWPRSAFHEILTITTRINLVAADRDGRIVGYVLAQCAADEVHIDNIAVAGDLQRQGIGSLLLTHAESEGVARGALCSVLDVRVDNEAALALYQKFGYRMIGRRKDYYKRPVCDALVLFRRLDQPMSASEVQEHKDGMVP